MGGFLVLALRFSTSNGRMGFSISSASLAVQIEGWRNLRIIASPRESLSSMSEIPMGPSGDVTTGV